jgi:hypothetical protein
LSFSVKSVGNYLEYLPGDKHMLAQQAEILNDLLAYSPERNPPETIRLMMDDLQIALNRLNTSITTNWFYPDYSVS